MFIYVKCFCVYQKQFVSKVVNGGFAFVNGGYEFDGREMAPVNEDEIIKTVKKFVDDSITNFAICGVFSSTKQDQELRVLQ